MKSSFHFPRKILFGLLLLSAFAGAKTLNNTSYQLSGPLYDAYEPLFSAHWSKLKSEDVTLKHSNGVLSKAIDAILNGNTKVDVVTLNTNGDIDKLANAGLVDKNWRAAFPNDAIPYHSTIVFLVRRGNPKNIRNWDDLIKPKTSFVFPNPTTSGNGKYTYLAALAYAQETYSSEAEQDQFMKDLLLQTAVFDNGGKEVTNRFISGNIGDALLTFESEAYSILQQNPKEGLQIVVPKVSVRADFPVAIVEKNARANGNFELAQEYLNYLFSSEAQELLASFNYRVVDKQVANANSDKFPIVKMKTPEEIGGSWAEINKTHFASGGKFFQLQK